MWSVQPSFRRKQVKNKSGLKIYTRANSILVSPNRRSVIFYGTLRKNNRNRSLLSSSSSNTMHMSLCLVNGNSSFGDSTASNNPPQVPNYELSASESASASSSPSPTPPPPPTTSSQGDESRLQGQPVGSAASTEEQRKMMSKSTNTTISHGVISVVGRRRSMEDAVTIAPGLLHETKVDGTNRREVVSRNGYDFFAVYNGRGSHTAAQKCKERMHHVVVEQSHVVGADNCNWERVMVTSFAKMEDEFGSNTQELDDLNLVDAEVAIVQSMALVVLVGKEEIVVANCGHSRAVVYRDGAAVPLCHHQLEKPEEERTCSLKQQMISVPDVNVHKRTPSDYFLIIATDGLWNVVSNEVACDIVKKRCFEVASKKMIDGVIGNGADACAAMLVELALARGSKDNISVIVVELQHFRADSGSSSSSSSVYS